MSQASQLFDERLKACVQQRLAAIDALEAVVATLVCDVTTERDAAIGFARELRARGLNGYWYPAAEEVGSPQFGCIVAFDTVMEPSRSQFRSGRRAQASKEVAWQGFGYFYASPHTLTDHGIAAWGDVGCTIYQGDSPIIRQSLKLVWEKNRRVLARLNRCPDPTTRDLFQLNEEEASAQGLRNIGWSSSANVYNIGHDVPFKLMDGQGDDSLSEIRESRRYIDGVTTAPIPESLWTYEPRDRPLRFPFGCIQFHEMLSAKRGGRVFSLPSYDDLFRKTGMNWMLTNDQGSEDH